MCRISGVVTKQRDKSIIHSIQCMTTSMEHGGPDDEGFYIDEELGIGLGHRRLSILDLSSAGHQPMWNQAKTIAIVFNGEIYNFKELKQQLRTLGRVFNSNTDTEVILEGYQVWGVKVFEKLNGMFAIGILDKNKNQLLLARDHIGIKPLYVHAGEDRFLFASEVRAFRAFDKDFPENSLWRGLFLLFGHLPEPYTTLEGVVALEPATVLTLDLHSFEVRHTKFYQPAFSSCISSAGESEVLVRDALESSVRSHLISDAPIGLFLSGGIDSSLLTLIAARSQSENLRTLSLQFDEVKYTESEYQRAIVAKTGAKHSYYKVGLSEFDRCYSDVLAAMDQPTVDGVNTYFISKYAKYEGLKAVLSGIGGDEVFGGYPSFERYPMWRKLRMVPSSLSKLASSNDYVSRAKLSFLHLPNLLSLYLMNRGIFTMQQASLLAEVDEMRLLDACFGVYGVGGEQHNNLLDNAEMEMTLYLKDQLLKDADSLGMWHGVEIRVPFLDRPLLEKTNAIDPGIRFFKSSKRLLKNSFKSELPPEIFNRRKQGFTLPFEHWFKQSQNTRPSNNNERMMFDMFKQGKVHWSKYWALKIIKEKCI